MCSKKLPVSAVVVCFNEFHLLEKCLSSVQFCEEVIMIDLGSTDKSIEIAKKYTTSLLHYPKVPVVEQLRTAISDKVKYDWILFIDPDESIDKELALEMKEIFYTLPADIGCVAVPWQFYFKQQPLYGTYWGMENTSKIILVNRNTVVIPVDVHKGYTCRPGYKIKTISRSGSNVLHHYWMNSWRQLIKKHKRYLLSEGEAKYNLGWRYNSKKQGKHFFSAFYDSFVIYKGWKSGFTGLLLSLFYAWYNFKIWTSLKKFQKITK